MSKWGITYPLLHDVETLTFKTLGILNAEQQPGDRGYGIPYPGMIVIAPDGAVVGMAGLLSSEFMEASDLRHQVAVAELDLDVAVEPALPRFEALARYPSVVVDMTVEHGAELSFDELAGTARDLAGEWVEDLSYVTQFKPEGDSRVVRTTLRLVYRHPDRSLTQEEVNEAHEKLRHGLGESFEIGFA